MTGGRGLDTERWKLIESVLDKALDAVDESRAQAVLNELCGDDAQLREEVAGLLEASRVDGDVLDQAASGAAPDLLSELGEALEAQPEALAGRRLGAYRLVEVLGQGGMGVVYLAERADEQFEQRVAIKLMPRGMETAEMERRLLLERQILANLQHPNIAHLLDGQVTEEGFPYLVMEHIEGRSIDVYCRDQRLTLEERLRLFRDVCAAVQYAHQNMVIHRDLKPSNILVTEVGQVKLLDFGIAKLTDPSMAAPATDGTVYQPLTPTYASPEQVSNGPVMAASDVYSLGVVLYQLLTGVTPYRLDGMSPSEVEEVVTQRQSAAPSQAIESTAATGIDLDPRKLRQRVSGDLDTIVLKCLRKTPERRYGSAAELSEDIERFLGGQPVRARPNTWSYRARRFVRRHKLGTAAAVVILLLLVGGVVGIAWQGLVAARERDRAQLEARKAERVADFLGGLFEAANPTTQGAGQLSVRELLDIGEERIHRELANEPEIQLEMLELMANSYGALGQDDKAIAMMQEVVEERKAIMPHDELAMASALTSLAGHYNSKGDYGRSEPLLTEAMNLYEKNDATRSAQAGMTWRYLGVVQGLTGQDELAERSHRQAMEIWREVGKPDFEAGEMSNVSGMLEALGRHDEALELKEEALELVTDYYGPEHPVVATVRNNIAFTLHNKGDYEAAEKLYREALAVNERLLGADGDGVADNLTNLGRLLMDQERYTEADDYIRRAAEIRIRLNEPTHFHRIAAEINLASLQVELGEYEKAIAAYRSALERFESLVGPAHNATARVQCLLGIALHRTGEFVESERLLRQALKTQVANGAPESHIEATRLDLESLLRNQGRNAEADALLAESKLIAES